METNVKVIRGGKVTTEKRDSLDLWNRRVRLRHFMWDEWDRQTRKENAEFLLFVCVYIGLILSALNYFFHS